jgi:asparagine synthase (glutamine-hydrolysing)
MCGIAGMAVRNGLTVTPADRADVDTMIATLTHRGPDGTRAVYDATCAVAFSRLAIVDPPGGQQPFSSADGMITVLVNGEIFNHEQLRAGVRPGYRWQGRSDTEAVLARYESTGISGLKALRGMYAAVVVDRREQAVYLLRDRLGIKPLFYSSRGRRLVFASEIKALLAAPGAGRAPGFDWVTALADPAINGHIAAPAGPPPSYFTDISQLPAAHVLRFDLATGALRLEEYWRLGEAAEDFRERHGTQQWSAREWTAAYRELLQEAVTDSLMSDVEIGCFLSGGVDSTVIAAIAARQDSAIHCFSVCSDSTLANGDAYFAQEAAASLGLPHHQVDFTGPGCEVTAESYLELLKLCETPLLSPEQFFKFQLHRYAKQTRPGLKVMLTGQGSDEFNGGYTTLFGTDWESNLDGLGYLAEGRAALDAGLPVTVWNEHFNRRLLTPAAHPRGAGVWETYVAGKSRDLQTYNCWHEDRTASGNGVENRVPFLDHRLVELCMAVPQPLRAELLWDKRILRQSAREWLPERFADRPKVPFFYGPKRHAAHQAMLDALRADHAALFEHAMSGPGAQEYLDTAAMRRTLADFEADPRLGNFEFFARLVNMALLDKLAGSPDALRLRPGADGSPVALRRAEPVPSPGAGGSPVVESAVYTLAPDVMALTPLHTDDEWYVAVNGTVEYVLPLPDSDDWRRVVMALDGRRTLGEAVRAADVKLVGVEELLVESLEAGIVTRLEGSTG